MDGDDDGRTNQVLPDRRQLPEEPAPESSGAQRAIRLIAGVGACAAGLQRGGHPVELAIMLGDLVTSLPAVAARIASCLEPFTALEGGWPQAGDVELWGHF